MTRTRVDVGVALILILVIGANSQVSAQPAEAESTRDVFAIQPGWRGRPQLDPKEDASYDPDRRVREQEAWNADARQHWRLETVAGEPEIVSDGRGVFLTTARDYGDFELRLDWKMVTPGGDSGIYLRGCPQVQIWDPQDEKSIPHGADRGSGALWNNSDDNPGKWPLTNADAPIGSWNSTRIVMVGSRVWVWLNEAITVDGAVLENFWDKAKPVAARGCIQLQTHGGEIRFRRVSLRELPVEDANQWLRTRAGKGFRPLFDGRSLEGWQGPTKANRVADGSLLSREGTLFTKDQFENFELQLEFAIPPAGNNGLAIRYPGAGDGAYEGMCELQVLDSEHPSYAGLDPRQYHGSAYGIVAAHRGYLRPANTWNHQIVRVRGNQVEVELNGTPILDADLSQVDKFLDDHPHPGLKAMKGHLGLCGHGDPVRYRRIEVRELGGNSHLGFVPGKQTECRASLLMVHDNRPQEISVPFLLFCPADYDTSFREWPLLLFLHGAGESGDGALDLVKRHGPPRIVEENPNFPFVVISPQCPIPQDSQHYPTAWKSEPLLALIHEVERIMRIDDRRLYVTGLSMGGYGTWRLAATYPNRFAAAIPICGGGDPAQAPRLKSLPIWCFHGARDPVVPLSESETMVNAIRKAGGEVEFTVYPDADHDSWTETYRNPEVWNWLARQKK